ncbi:MAG: hypothetical protein JNL72_14325 [Flavipsychrobacter sp.]|nr:hypothetical protein [Flavipsychrobacter sp.]
MMMNVLKKALLLTLGLTPLAISGQAQETTDSVKLTRKKLYMGAGMDMAYFSTTLTETKTGGKYLSPLRFHTYAFNLSFNFNYDITNSVGLFTGINLKNIGFIQKYSVVDSTVKRRVLTLGVPLGIKVGNLSRHVFGFAGGGVDVPFNYREKGFRRRGNKDKFNEWFSERTPAIMPYVFAGVCLKPGITLKAQYYTTNFLNTSFTETVTLPGTQTTYITSPYSNYTKLNLLLLSVGFDLRYSKKSKAEPVSAEPAMRTM